MGFWRRIWGNILGTVNKFAPGGCCGCATHCAFSVNTQIPCPSGQTVGPTYPFAISQAVTVADGVNHQTAARSVVFNGTGNTGDLWDFTVTNRDPTDYAMTADVTTRVAIQCPSQGGQVIYLPTPTITDVKGTLTITGVPNLFGTMTVKIGSTTTTINTTETYSSSDVNYFQGGYHTFTVPFELTDPASPVACLITMDTSGYKWGTGAAPPDPMFGANFSLGLCGVYQCGQLVTNSALIGLTKHGATADCGPYYSNPMPAMSQQVPPYAVSRLEAPPARKRATW